MTYIELNMVRAVAVPHPQRWPWCSYHEWMGQCRRRTLVSLKRGREFIGNNPVLEFQANYRQRIEEAIAKNELEPYWTQSIAVGRQEFVEEIAGQVRYRQTVESQTRTALGFYERRRPHRWSWIQWLPPLSLLRARVR